MQSERGKRGERRLCEWLDRQNLKYQTEDELKGKYSKTPDVLLKRRCLELLSDILSLNLAELGFDITALYNFIDRNFIETPSTLYFNPKYSNNIETILKNTYYMIYVLETLNLYTKDSQKIRNYITSNLNYTNIKNIYYSYKISELLNLDIEFDIYLIRELVQNIYSEDLYEFYLTSSRNTITSDSTMAISTCSFTALTITSCDFGIYPPVSTSRNSWPHQSASAKLRSLVTPGLSSTIACLRPIIRLNRVDLPTFGLPTMVTTDILMQISSIFL